MWAYFGLFLALYLIHADESLIVLMHVIILIQFFMNDGRIAVNNVQKRFIFNGLYWEVHFQRHASLLVIPGWILHYRFSLPRLTNFYKVHVTFLWRYHLQPLTLDVWTNRKRNLLQTHRSKLLIFALRRCKLVISRVNKPPSLGCLFLPLVNICTLRSRFSDLAISFIGDWNSILMLVHL